MTLDELYALLDRVAASQMTNKTDIMRAIQNQIADKYFSYADFDHLTYDMTKSLGYVLDSLPMNKLEKIMKVYQRDNLIPPQVFLTAYYQRKENIALEHLEKIIKEIR